MLNMIFNTHLKIKKDNKEKESKKKRKKVESLGTDTSLLLQTVSNVPTKFSYISCKKTSIIRTLSNTDNRH